MLSSRPSSPMPSRPPRPASPFGIPFPRLSSSPGSTTSSPVPSPSPSPRHPATLPNPSAPSISRAPTPMPLAFPQLPELSSIKVPVPPSPTPRSQKVSLWIDRLPRRGKDELEGEVRRVFETGQARPARLGARSKSLGTMHGLYLHDAADTQIGSRGSPSSSTPDKDKTGAQKVVWWNIALTPVSPPPSRPAALPRAQTTSVFTSPSPSPLRPRQPSSPERPSFDTTSPSFYQRLSQVDSTDTLTPSSSSHSSPSTPSLTFSSSTSSSSASFAHHDTDDDDDDDNDDGRESHTSTPTPTLPLSPASPSQPAWTTTLRPLRLPSQMLKRRSTTGDLLGRYLVTNQSTSSLAPKPAKEVDKSQPTPVNGSPIGRKRALPFRFGMWRREK